MSDSDHATLSATPARRILIVDDSRLQRRIVAAFLTRWGYAVVQAANGEEALALCGAGRIDMVISDWMMPGMSGPEFCRAFRALPRDGYGYFILLTGRSEKSEVARGLDMGADDYLAKPVDPAELRARIAAGERILRMEETLRDRNRALQSALGELRGLYDLIDRDLAEARRLQQSLVRERFRNFGTAEVALFLEPCGHVGGDLVGFFPTGVEGVGFFSLDVSGHGVSSALMTARLAGMLSDTTQRQGASFLPLAARGPPPPEDVAARLNRLLLDEMETDHYATLVYGEADLLTGRVRLVQAGHPHPAILRASGQVEFVGQGGMPVGLIEEASYEGFDLRLNPGDRLLVLSDGVTECPDAKGRELGQSGLTRILRQNRTLAGAEYLDGLVEDIARHAAGRDATDDMSGVMFHFRGDR